MLRLVSSFFFVVAASAAIAQNTTDIYRITATGCADGSSSVQTGFAIANYDGILTALHGVVGCDDVVASSTQFAFSDLKIAEVDLDRDVALLRSETEVVVPLGSFEIAQTTPNDTANVYGFPQGISLYEIPLSVPSNSIRPLKELLTDAILNELKSRNSPNVDVNVVSLNGNLQPGHSGAPIIQGDNRIVAIANGGLAEGAVGIGWGVPTNELQFLELAPNSAELVALATGGTRGQFSIVATDAIASSKSIETTSGLGLLGPTLYRIWIEEPDPKTSSSTINPIIRRTVGENEDKLALVVYMDGKEVWSVNALGKTEFQYFRNWDGTNFVAWIEAFHSGRHVIVSNIAYYRMGNGGKLYAEGGPYDETGEFSGLLAKTSKYPPNASYLSLNLNWDTGIAVIGGAGSISLKDHRLVFGGVTENDVTITPVSANPLRVSNDVISSNKYWYAYLVQETGVGMVPVSNIVLRD